MDNNIVWLDGEYVAYADATIAPLSHSLSYATSVYEGMRSYHGVIFKLDAHLARLRQSAEVFGHDISYSEKILCDVCYELLNINALVEAYVKIQVFYDDADVSFMGRGCRSRFLITVLPMMPRVILGGMELFISLWRRPPANCHPYGAKTSSTYALSYLSFQARPKGADDVLFLSSEGEVCEASGANIFFVKGNTLVTPTTEKCLAGITRHTILKELAPDLGLETEVRTIFFNEINNFDAAFLCGTAIEIHAVKKIDDIHYLESRHVNRLVESYKNMVMRS